MKKTIILFSFFCLLSSCCYAQWGYQKPDKGIQIDWANSLSKGLVAYWPMWEGCGSLVYDISGNNNTGTLYGNTTWIAGKFGSCLYFDGNGDYVQVPYDQFASLTKGTISHSVYAPSINFFGFGIADKDVSYRQSFSIFRSTYKFAFSILNVSGSYVLYKETNSTFNLNQWYHVVIVQDGVAIKIYVNGKDEPLSNVPGVTITGNGTEFFSSVSNVDIASIGAILDSTPGYANGQIDHVKIFNRALMASEVALLYREPFFLFAKMQLELMYSPAAEAPSGQIIFTMTE